MRAIFSAILLSAISVLPCLAQSTSYLVTGFPKGSAKLEAFCPRGWEVENKLSLDLNRDSKKDVVLQLMTSAGAKEGASRNRALVVAFGDGRENYKLADYADRLLLCTTCGGKANVKIKMEAGPECFKLTQTALNINDGFAYSFTFANTFANSQSKKFHVDRAEFSDYFDRVGHIGKIITLNFKDRPSLTTTLTGGKCDKVASKVIVPREIFMRDIDLNKLPIVFKGYPTH